MMITSRSTITNCRRNYRKFFKAPPNVERRRAKCNIIAVTNCLTQLRATTILAFFALCIQAPCAFAGASGEGNWEKVKFATRDHAPLLKRQEKLSAEQSHDPVVVTVLVLEPDLQGKVTAVTASYDRMEGPSEAKVTLTERGILDDDLIAVRHEVDLARNSNNEWHVVGYKRGELRRAQMH